MIVDVTNAGDIPGVILCHFLLFVSRQRSGKFDYPITGVDPDMAVLFFLPVDVESRERTGLLGFIWRHPAVFIGVVRQSKANVIEVAEAIPFVDLTDWRHERLYELKGRIVAAGVKAVTGFDMPFWSMVRFMVKWSVAAIPALIILAVAAFIVVSILSLVTL